MWARVFEFSFAIWLIFSPFIFGHFGKNFLLTTNDITCGLLIMIFSSLSFANKFIRIHFINFFIGLYLIILTFLIAPIPSPGGFQNYVVIGILLLMFAILPSHASQIPLDWQRFYLRHKK
jgi:hypothetical protein